MRKTRRERKEAPIRVFDRFSQLLVVAQWHVLVLRSVSVARSGLASPSRRGVEPKDIRAQAREVRMASSAAGAD